jgi:hypothetical protein
VPHYSFEVVRADGSSLVAAKRDLPSHADAWGHLEVLAIQLRHRRDVQLCVRDSDGSIVILSGIAIAIAAIERCGWTACPIKDLLASGAPTCACAPCMTIPVSKIPWLNPRDRPSIDSAIANDGGASGGGRSLARSNGFAVIDVSDPRAAPSESIRRSAA